MAICSRGNFNITSKILALTLPHFTGISGASYYEGFFANIARNDAGEYVAVSSRGNFYMTWQAGQVGRRQHTHAHMHTRTHLPALPLYHCFLVL